MKKPKIIRCPYCGGTAILRDASFVYGTHSHGGQVYVCSHYPSCNSYVGVHPGTKIPKGTLANRELRQKRIQAHRIFDQIWQQGTNQTLLLEHLTQLGTGQSSTIQKGIVALYLQQQGYTSFDLAKHYQVPANRVRAWQSKARKLLQQDDALYALLT